MTRDHADILLQMLSPTWLSQSKPTLSETDLDAVVSLAVAHRVAPVLYRNFQRIPNWRVPDSAMCRLKNAHAASAKRSITLVRNLVRVEALLSSAGIDWAALKGAFLSLHAYPEPALRPVRDLDILVEQDRAEEAFELLLKSGFERRPDEAIPHDKGHRRHLPALIEPETGMIVELHTRLFDSGDPAAIQSFARRALTRANRTPVAGREIPYLLPHDNALHLIVHAALDHTFDNGPLIFSDLYYLTRTVDFDWETFWTETRNLGFERAANIVLHLTERYQGSLDALTDSRAQAIPSDMLDGAVLLVLGDYQRRSTHALRASLAELHGSRRIGELARHAIPTRYALRTFAGPKRVRWPIPLIYGWWAVSRVTQLVKSHLSASNNTQAKAAGSLQAWLRSAH